MEKTTSSHFHPSLSLGRDSSVVIPCACFSESISSSLIKEVFSDTGLSFPLGAARKSFSTSHYAYAEALRSVPRTSSFGRRDALIVVTLSPHSRIHL